MELIAGRRGEELASGVLAYLLQSNSKFVEALLAASGSELSLGKNGSEVVTEWSTYSSNAEGGGRLDIYVRSGDVAIGIETKIWADFQSNQPLKYCERLIRECNEEGIRQRFIVVLAPYAKRREAGKALEEVSRRYAGSQITPLFISWADLIKRFESVVSASPRFQVLVEELRDFVDGRIWFTDFSADVFPKLSCKDGAIWREEHRQLIDSLWHIFPGEQRRLGVTSDWLGRSFFSSKGEWLAWYGFVCNSTQLDGHEDDDPARVSFVVSPSCNIADQLMIESTRFPVLRFRKNWDQRDGWLIDYTTDWSSLGRWDEELQELFAKFSKFL